MVYLVNFFFQINFLFFFFIGHLINHFLFYLIWLLVVHGKYMFSIRRKGIIFFVFRGGAQGLDENIFPRRMEIDWVYYYQWR